MAISTVNTDMQAYYAMRAASYENLYATPALQADLQKLQPLVQEALLGHHVLELACGTGYWTQQIADVAESVLATDNNPAMLAQASAKGLPQEKVSFAEMDALHMQSASNVTACFAAGWWSHVLRQDQSAYLDHCRAQLGKDALLVLIDQNFVEGRSIPVARTDLAGNIFQIHRHEPGLIGDEGHEILHNYPTDSALRKKFADATREIRIVRTDNFWMLRCRMK